MYGEWKWDPDMKCPKCHVAARVKFRIWTSPDEAHEDVNYFCDNCKYEWWVDGIDS